MIRKSPHRTHRDERYFEIRCAALEMRVRDLETLLRWVVEMPDASVEVSCDQFYAVREKAIALLTAPGKEG